MADAPHPRDSQQFIVNRNSLPFTLRNIFKRTVSLRSLSYCLLLTCADFSSLPPRKPYSRVCTRPLSRSPYLQSWMTQCLKRHPSTRSAYRAIRCSGYAPDTLREKGHRTDCCADIPNLPRQVNPLYHLQMGWHRRSLRPFLPANCHGQRLVHHSLLPRHLSIESISRFPTTEIRSVIEPGRRTRGWRIVTAYKARSGIQTIHQKTSRIQVLALCDQGGGD